ncbi:MAG: hypothetical protein NVS3B12_25580 [Acidimicrobiales bacterium]
MIIDLEVDAVLVTQELVAAAVQPDRILLEPVAKTRLDDPPPSLDVVEQQVEAVAKVIVEPGSERAHEAREQESTGTRRWLGREEQLAQCDAPGRGDGSGVANLQLGQEHRQSVGDELCVLAKSGSDRGSRWRTTGLATH